MVGAVLIQPNDEGLPLVIWSSRTQRQPQETEQSANEYNNANAKPLPHEQHANQHHDPDKLNY